MITHLEPDILEYEVKWVLESITTNKASGSDGIPAELFQILKDDAMKVLHLICQQILENLLHASCEMPDWMKHKLESRLKREISIASDTQMTPPLWQKVKRN